MGALVDAQRAMRLVRSRAVDFNISADDIGALGFSAGGHLVASLANHHKDRHHNALDSVDSLSARPDFVALAYPVISFKEFTHGGSKLALLGETPKKEHLDYFSLDEQVNNTHPPTFLVHATDDEGVPVENSLRYFAALKKNDVPVAMHIYPRGGHGFSLAPDTPVLRTWPDRLIEWVRSDR